MRTPSIEPHDAERDTYQGVRDSGLSHVADSRYFSHHFLRQAKSFGDVVCLTEGPKLLVCRVCDVHHKIVSSRNERLWNKPRLQ